MSQVLSQLPNNIKDERLLVGLETSDDAAVYKINDDTALIQTLDFFTPVVDDLYAFGQIAATNSLSDVYAMGGEPRMAMNIVCFPNCLEPEVLVEILKGGYDKVTESGAMIIGGHTVQDDEPKYGLSVAGFVHPDKILTNSNAKVGDVLILTKPIGMGVLTAAIKGELATEEEYNYTVKNMTTLNKYAKEAFDNVKVNSLTDVTGFGLLGHALEMAEGSNVTIEIESENVPFMKGAIEYAKMGLVPAGAYDNRYYIGDRVVFLNEIDGDIEDLLFDPQTSGGLLASIPESELENALKALENTPTEFGVIGRVIEKEEKSLIVK